MTTRAKFSIEDGIKTQAKQLNDWSKVLKPKMHNLLVKWATANNKDKRVKNGYDIVRGADLDMFIVNSLINKHISGQPLDYRYD